MKVVGIEYMNFRGNDGQQVQCFKVHCVEDFSSKSQNCIGVKTVSFTLSPDRYQAVQDVLGIDQDIEPIYNRYGKVQSVVKAGGIV